MSEVNLAETPEEQEKEVLEFDWLKLQITYNDNYIEISIKDNYVRDKKPIYEENFINKVSSERKKQGEFLKIITNTMYNCLYNNLKNILPIELTNKYFGYLLTSNMKETNNNIMISTIMSNTDISSYLSTTHIIPIILDSLKNLEIKLKFFTFEILFSKDFQDYSTKTLNLDDNSFSFLIFKKEKNINIIINNQEEILRTIIIGFSFKEKNNAITFSNIDILQNRFISFSF